MTIAGIGAVTGYGWERETLCYGRATHESAGAAVADAERLEACRPFQEGSRVAFVLTRSVSAVPGGAGHPGR
jgi:hypothetical protein